MDVPIISIITRHSVSCDHRGDETYKRCDCRKALRYFYDGRQYRVSAKSRTIQGAEDAKRRLEEKFRSGQDSGTVAADKPKTLREAVSLFLTAKKGEGVTTTVIGKYKRELERFTEFMSARGKLFPTEITKDDLVSFRETWDEIYPSSYTRQKVQERLHTFLRDCRDAGRMKEVLRLKPIRAEEPPTLPLSEDEYKQLLKAITNAYKTDSEKGKRVRTLVQLMRWSGLAIHDASTLERNEIVRDGKLYRVVTKRQKTGTHVSVPLPDNVANELLAVLNGNPKYVFWHGEGNPESAPKYFQREFREKVKLEGFHPHRLRDTFAVYYLQHGADIREVSKMLGHSSIKVTEKSYAPWVKSLQDRLDKTVTRIWKRNKR